jgi:hypothetical protein
LRLNVFGISAIIFVRKGISDVSDSWQLETIGGGIVTTPDGDESYFCARMVLTMTREKTIRFLLYLMDDKVPSVCVVNPSVSGSIAGAMVDAFEALTELVP